MRKGFPGLALLVQETLKRDPFDDDLFIFRGRRGDLIKIVWHDGQGSCLFAKRLERGRLLWSSVVDGVVTISTAQPAYLLDGGCLTRYVIRARFSFANMVESDRDDHDQALLRELHFQGPRRRVPSRARADVEHMSRPSGNYVRDEFHSRGKPKGLR
jgi:transposase